MPRSLRELWKLWGTPIDWAAVAEAQPGSMRKGSKHRRESIAKGKATVAAKVKAKRKAAWARRKAEVKAQHRAEWARRRAIRWPERIAAVMDPEGWYTLPGLRVALGGPYGSLKAALNRMEREGTVERRDHAAPVPEGAWKTSQYEYRLTLRGRALRAYALRVL